MQTDLNPDYAIIGVSDAYLNSIHESIYDEGSLTRRYVSGVIHPSLMATARRFRRWFRFGNAEDISELDELALEFTASAVRILRHCDALPPSYAPLSARKTCQAVECIEAHLADKLSVFDVALACGMSAYQFSRRFTATTGLSPHQFIMERRLNRAGQHLRYSEATIAEIAYAVGFASHAHMTRTFQSILGTTPSIYRASFR